VRVVITGATGFVGSALVSRLLSDGKFSVRATARREHGRLPPNTELVVTGDIDEDTNWADALVGSDVVVHLAARVHVMHESEADPMAAFRRVNVAGSLNLARQAAAAGIRRFVYVSSVKVNGESGSFTESDPPAPEDAYGRSKLEAETGLRRLAADTRMEVVIVRPPLVYGPGVKANFRALARAIAQGIPLPLGAIRNRRSLVSLDNLVDLLIICLDHPAAANEIFLVSDGEDMSTADLARRLGWAIGRPARLIPVPAGLLMAAASLLGKRDVAGRLVGSLQVDISKARRLLSWSPPVSVDEGLKRTAISLS
jgi:nucleoside-diphosphate-sugar epimerase